MQITMSSDRRSADVRHKNNEVITFSIEGFAKAYSSGGDNIDSNDIFDLLNQYLAWLDSIESTKNTILIVGFSESHSLAGKLKLHPKEVKIFGEPYQVNAAIETIDSMSAHGDYEDLLKWLSCQDINKVDRFFLVHGEYENQLAMQKRLQQKGFKNVLIPKMHEQFKL